MIVVIIGVAGSGKTTIGRLLARALGWPYYEGDDFHPRRNVARMARGEPLTDADREPWLAALEDLLRDLHQRERSAVLTCSALREPYRRRLAAAADVHFVFLSADPAVIERRLRERRGHYMKAPMATSQFAQLEEPKDALRVDACRHPAEIVRDIIASLGLPERAEKRDRGKEGKG